MAKKKKHKLKKHNRRSNNVTNTTNTSASSSKSDILIEKNKSIEAVNSETKTNNKVENQESLSVRSDVKFSLILLGVIIIVFILIFAAFTNKSISDSVYGLVKINL